MKCLIALMSFMVLAPSAVGKDAVLIPWTSSSEYDGCTLGVTTLSLKFVDSRDRDEEAAAPWFHYLEDQIFKNTKVSFFQEAKEMSYLFIVKSTGKAGKIEVLKLEKSSGNQDLDQQFEEVLRDAAPIEYRSLTRLPSVKALRAKWVNGKGSVEPVRTLPKEAIN